MKKALMLFAALICLAVSGIAVAFILTKTQVPMMVTTVGYRATKICVFPLLKSATVELEFVDIYGEPREKRVLTLKDKDYPKELVATMERAIDEGLRPGAPTGLKTTPSR